MRKLYWKIFIWFWISTILTIITIALISSKVTQHSSNRMKEQAFLDTVSSAAELMAHSNNLDNFKQWALYINKRFGITAYVVSKDSPLQTTSETSTRLQRLTTHIQQNIDSTVSYNSKPYFVSAPVTTQDGKQLKIILKIPSHITDDFNFSWPDIILKLTLAIVISGFICYVLSLYLSRPIRVLQRAARRLGRGDLQTRVGKEFSNRNDEFAQLGYEFDDMASRLQSLIQTHAQLLQDISHELRSPIARLSVALELARKKTNNASEAELNRIETECSRLNELIGKILSLSSLNRYDKKIKLETCNVQHIIQTVIDDANFEIQSKHSKIDFTVNGNCILQANSALLRSAIENIIRNALRYTPTEQLIVVNLTQSTHCITITIRDHGEGIPEEKITHIFEPFYRVDDSRNANTGGFGLGLAIAKKAISLHGGTIKAANRPEGGLEITLKLPC
jgi:two-component system, OmpR family, sensor histidine kinase CpxA